MRLARTVTCGVAAVAMTVAPMSSASAHWHHRYDGGCWFVGCVVGAVVGTAAAVVTAPFRIVAGAVAPRPYYESPEYGPPAYDAPDAYDAPPPRDYYDRPPAAYGRPDAYDAPPQGYYDSRRDAPDYGPEPGYGPQPDDRAPPDAYGPPEGYGPPDENGPPPDYPPPGY